jgi:hypothetical protein
LFQNWNDPTVNVDLELHAPSVYQDNRSSAPSSVRITLGTGEIEQKVTMVIQDVVPPVEDTMQQIKMVLQQSVVEATRCRELVVESGNQKAENS